MKMNIICFGKIKDKHLQESINDFLKRINNYCETKIIEIAEEKIMDEQSFSLIKIALEKESLKLKKYFKDSYNVLLDVNSKEMDSLEFAKFIDQKQSNTKQLNFYIGSSHGFDEQLKKEADFKISFSKMTFNHQIFRLMLTEQIYRAFSIINNTKYHK